ncbi:MAG: hypothetical protein M1823_003619 [Watsoniomyces obsoletus]|nr:MAG: hypothetical protein M1823_003619 [Watsoniomyces obsoletus]
MLETIFSRLEKRDQVSVSRVCQRFCSVMTPIIYGDIACGWDPHSSNGFPIDLLLRTCIEQPEIGSLVQTLMFDGPIPKFFGSTEEQRTWLAEESIPMLDAWVFDEEQEVPPLPEAVRQGHSEAMLALLLFKMPRLKHLDISLNLSLESAYLGPMLQFLAGTESHAGVAPPGYQLFPRLKHLENVRCRLGLNSLGFEGDHRIDCWPRPPPPTFDDFTAFFYLPSIRILYLEVSPCGNLAWPSVPPCTSTLRTLLLSNCLLSEEDLGGLLAVTPNLEELYYDAWRNTEAEDRASRCLHGDRLRDALEHVRARLTTLCVSVNFVEMPRALSHANPADCGITKTLGSLKDFTRLTDLDAPIELLLGASPASAARLTDILPDTIEELALLDRPVEYGHAEWPEEALMDQIGEHLANWRKRTPSLTIISLLLKFTRGGSWLPEQRKKLRDMCKRAGVSCDIFKQAEDIDPPENNFT